MYGARLSDLGLPTLEYRRERADVIQVCKVLHDIDKVDKSKLFSMSEYTETRGHSLKLFRRRSRLQIRANYFSNRVVLYSCLYFIFGPLTDDRSSFL